MTSSPGDKATAAAFMLALRQDHAGLSRILRAIDGLADRLVHEPDAVQPVLVEAFDYLLGYQHAYHHPREDRLFGKISDKRPALSDQLEQLAEEHESGEDETGRLAEDLAAAAPDELRGRTGERLAERVREYVRHARRHMRNEEAVFYERAERVLNKRDWAEIVEDDGLQDPLADLESLADDYPALADYFGIPTRHFAPEERRNHQPGALHRHALSLTDLYGGLLHEGFDLTRKNANRLLGVRGPVSLVRAVNDITSDNLRFVGQCVRRPSKWVIDTGAEWLGGPRRPDRES